MTRGALSRSWLIVILAAATSASLGASAAAPAPSGTSTPPDGDRAGIGIHTRPGRIFQSTFSAGDVDLAYEIVGSAEGPPLVVVNGGPGFDHGYLDCAVEAWETFAKKRGLVFYDQRGTGRSSALKPDQPCGLAEQIADLDALRAHLKLERMDLMGHSWGGYLVMAYAARHPERVSRLIIVDAAAPKIQ